MARGDDEDGSGSGVPWTRNPWLWTVVLVLVIAGAALASVVVGTDYRNPEVGDEDTTAMCAAVTDFSLAGGTIVGASADELRPALDHWRAIEAAAPEPIAATVTTLRETVEALIAELDAMGPAEDETAALARLQELQARFQADYEVESERFRAYVEQACGFDWVLGPPGTVAPGNTAVGTVPLPTETSVVPPTTQG